MNESGRCRSVPFAQLHPEATETGSAPAIRMHIFTKEGKNCKRKNELHVNQSWKHLLALET